ncbi:hypothetical protein APS67_003198 [Streptomyces sp. AVP053U2]|nr:hypothetical protein APS67_003198 [Streptomyces sp. AVP053U2]
MPYQQRSLPVVGDRRGGVHPQPGGLRPGEDLVGLLGVGAVVLGEPQQGVGPQGRLVVDGADLGFGGGTDDPQRLEGEAAQQGVLTAGGVEQLGDGAAHRPGGEPGAVLGAGGVGTQLGAAAEHVLGALLDVSGGALGGDADLLQLDPHRPAAERGEGGLSLAVGESAHGGEGAQGPVEERGKRGGVGTRPGGGGGGREGGRRRSEPGLGRRLGVGGAGGAGPVVDLAAFRTQFGDPLLQEVEKLRDGNRAGRQLEEGEHLRHGRDDLAHGGGLMALGLRVGERPGVEQSDPATQHGAVVAVPGAQPPAGTGGVAVHLDQAGEPGRVPVGADLSRGQAQLVGRPFGGRVGEDGLAGGGGAAPAGAQGRVGPAGDAGGTGQTGARHAGQLRRGRCAFRRAWRGAARALLVHRPGGGGQGSRADKSKSGVARDTGRHGCSLAVDGPKTQTECHTRRRGRPTHRGARAVGGGKRAGRGRGHAAERNPGGGPRERRPRPSRGPAPGWPARCAAVT